MELEGTPRILRPETHQTSHPLRVLFRLFATTRPIRTHKKILVSDSAPYFVYPRECVFFPPDLWRVLSLTGSRARVFVGTWGSPPSTRSDPNFRGPEISKSHRSIFVGGGDPSKSGQNPHKTQGHSAKNQKNTPLKPRKTPHYTPRKKK